MLIFLTHRCRLAEAFAFVNFARFAVPLRIGLALSTTPWIQTNILDRFLPSNDASGEIFFERAVDSHARDNEAKQADQGNDAKNSCNDGAEHDREPADRRGATR